MSKQMAKAQDFYRDFHWGDDAEEFVEGEVSQGPQGCDQARSLHSVAYETTKDGETAIWDTSSAKRVAKNPNLVVDVSNQQLHIVGGSYTVEPRGIVD